MLIGRALRVFAGILLAGSILAAPALGLWQRPQARARAAIPGPVLAVAGEARLDPDALRLRPEPAATPSATPAPMPTPVPAATIQALRPAPQRTVAPPSI